MTVRVLKAGMQTTLQSHSRSGLRHLGVPAGGAADPLSLALANRLVGNAWDAPAIEATLVGPTLAFDGECAFAVTGADVPLRLNGRVVGRHESLLAKPGDELVVGPARSGARAYVAVAGGFAADDVLGARSTDLQAGFGGHRGRALVSGDTLVANGGEAVPMQTPEEFRLPMHAGRALRTCGAAETSLLDDDGVAALFGSNWLVDRRADRMGLRLDGPRLAVSSDGRMPSAGVVPGTIQCPEDGAPYILSVDAGTVGGYPRVAQVARLDRHLLGQLRPGDRVRLLKREPDVALDELRATHAYWRAWLPDIERII